jgi:hypothetical protein
LYSGRGLVLTDIALHKRRFITFIVVDVLMILVAAAAMVGEFAFGISALRPVWIGAVVLGFAAQIWLIMGFRKAMTGKGT